MKDSDVQRIQHIKTYCEDITDAIKRFGNDFTIFNNDKDYFNSVSMSLMQIGELSIGLSDDFKERTKAQMPWGLIRGMRNMFAHAYASIDKISIWETAVDNIPELTNFCDSFINKIQ